MTLRMGFAPFVNQLAPMSFAQRLLDHLLTPQADRATDQAPGTCPNCWGHQGWDGKIRDLFADKQIDINNHKESHAFIQDFVVNHIDGIRLKKGNDGFACPHCHTVCSTEDGHSH